MMRMKDEVFDVDRIITASEQLIRFVNNKVVNPKGEFFYDGRSIDNSHRRCDIFSYVHVIGTTQ